jgi:hypothetical protein
MDIIRVSLISPGVRRPVVGHGKGPGYIFFESRDRSLYGRRSAQTIADIPEKTASELWNPGDGGRHWTSRAQTEPGQKTVLIGLSAGPRLRWLLAVLSADGIVLSELTLAAKRRMPRKFTEV